MKRSGRTTEPTRAAEKASARAEELFERYLSSHGIPIDYEDPVRGKSKRIDYCFQVDDRVIRCEVKALCEKRPKPNRPVQCDPCSSIRKIISEAAKQFKEYRHDCCVLVLFNYNDWEFSDWADVIFAAMLGDIEWKYTLDLNAADTTVGTASTLGKNVLADGGRMVNPRDGRLQNTTISAIAVLSEFTIPNPEFEREYRRLVRNLDRSNIDSAIIESLSIRDALQKKLPATLGDTQRLNVYENPVARLPLPQSCFAGDYDERYRYDPKVKRIHRVYAGEGIQVAEKLDERRVDVLQQIEPFMRSVVREFAPEKVILFGSHAWGAPHEDSDVDLLIVFSGNDDASDRALEIRKRIPRGFAMDLITRSAGQITQRLAMDDPFIREIVARGKVLYEADHA